MFQTFENPAAPAATAERIAGLRGLLGKAKLDGFLIPRADDHQGEYVPTCAERLAFLTGFTGSAGLAVILAKSAALFVDGRYTVQAPQQVDTGLFEVLQVPEAKLTDWLPAKLKTGGTVGFDPWLHTIAQIETLQKALKPKGISLKPVARNLVDRVWAAARPAPPQAPVIVHPLSLAGEAAADKVAALQKSLQEAGEGAVILTQSDSIAWLFNIRGSDVPHNPVVLAFAIVPARGKPKLFVDPAKIGTNSTGSEAKAYLKSIVKLQPPAALSDEVAALRNASARVRIDPASAAWWFLRALGGTAAAKNISRAKDPCLLPKAIKNKTEIAGSRAALTRDGVAMVRFLAWLDDNAASGKVDEIAAVKRLEEARRETGALKDISFDTISGAGANGAIVHYRVTEGTNRKLKSGELYLVDSGGQYADGTTDITRTVSIGKPSEDMRRCFTLVLKGHIAIATARFPKGTRGVELDPFARRALWEAGLDFDHGTGHGVGSFLSVHEGPQSISRRGMAELLPGMIVSNEPGYYREGAFGIRLENLALVTPLEKIAGGEREMMGFETLTLAPIDRRLVQRDMLSAAERDWLNAYHARVARELSSGLGTADRAWLNQATAPIA